MPDLHLITLSPGHFHAALIQKQMRPGVAAQARVYAPFDADLLAHLARIHSFNSRSDNPTAWQLEVYAGPDYLARFRQDARPGDVAVFAGRNRVKIDLMLAAVECGLHVLADKPWIIEAEQLPKLDRLLQLAGERDVLVYDVMTERFEITSILQRDLMQQPAVIGEILPGSAVEPAIFMRSVHYLKKLVAGTPLRRPGWFFDVHEQGEALTDVGTHLVDLVMWMRFPERVISSEEVNLLSAERWPLSLTGEQIAAVTGSEIQTPLDYWTNNRVRYTVNGMHVGLDVFWDYDSPGSDLHHAIVRGTRALVSVRQDEQTGGRPELFVRAHDPADHAATGRGLERATVDWQAKYHGVGVINTGDEFHIDIPPQHRTSHEEHFSQVLDEFLRRRSDPRSLPAWESVNLRTKYFTTTQGVRLARAVPAGSP